MIAAVLREFAADRSGVRLEERPVPRPQPGELRVEMLAAAINPADLNIIEGKYGELPALPAVIGNEGVGRVVELGAGVSGFSPGNLVLPLGRANWAGELCVPAERAVRLPDGLDPWQAAMLTVNPPSAWGLLEDFERLRPGDWLAQNAANSAVGRCVIQLARARGLRTFNVVRRPELEAELKALGADEVATEDEDPPASADAAFAAVRPRLALNAVGGPSALRLANLLADGGTLVTYGAMGRQPLKIPNGLLIFRDLRFRGFWLRRLMENPARLRRAVEEMADLSRSGRLSLPIHRVFGLGELPAALDEAMKEGRSGKVLLDLRR